MLMLTSKIVGAEQVYTLHVISYLLYYYVRLVLVVWVEDISSSRIKVGQLEGTMHSSNWKHHEHAVIKVTK